MTTTEHDSAQLARRAAGEAAAALVEDGMRLGLGTGSTAAEAISALGRRVRDEGLRIVGVPTSYSAERLARRHGVPIVSIEDLGLDSAPPGSPVLDLALDGADEIDPGLNLIKGRGAAQTRERVVASLAKRFVVLADEGKLVERLGTRSPVPVEVVPMAVSAVSRTLRGLGAEPTLREGKAKDGPVVTDQGLWIIDARFAGIGDPAMLSAEIDRIPGVLDHGIFVGLASEALVGMPDGAVKTIQRRDSSVNG